MVTVGCSMWRMVMRMPTTTVHRPLTMPVAQLRTLIPALLYHSPLGEASKARGPGPPEPFVRGSRAAGTASDLQVLELLGKLGQVPAALPGDQDHVLDPHPAHAEVVEPGLHRHDGSGLQPAVPGPHRRSLVDVQPHPVAGPVEEPH